jgi:AraC family transcriptional regulator
MDPVQKALWFVESHLREPLALEDVARTCHVSAFHLTRAFSATLGWPLMRYVRARRLSVAARQLAQGADDILSIALEAGYGSHEAFTRAFRDHFARTPEQVRAQGNLDNMQLVEAIAMSTAPVTELAPPRFETLNPRLLAGLVQRYDCQASAGIPNQWQQFTPYLGAIPRQIGQATYGVKFNFDGESSFDYLCGVEVAGSADLPQGFTSLQLLEQRYAVFAHRGHVAGVRATFAAIWSKWFPESGHTPADAPTFERYGSEFNPVSGLGGFEIWIPIQ